jgi:XTP/dITP diphosphohydrolase
MKDLVFATHNKKKADEVKALFGDSYRILTLDDIGCNTEIPETESTFAGNASLKSKFVVAKFQLDCFADDSGLEVEALDNAPGIYSARYSGGNDEANYKLVLEKLQGVSNRKAQFRTVISLIQEGQEYFFEGVLTGILRDAPIGNNGFGYDPIFQPNGYDITLAQMTMEEKNAISHRAIAMRELIRFLSEQSNSSEQTIS